MAHAPKHHWTQLEQTVALILNRLRIERELREHSNDQKADTEDDERTGEDGAAYDARREVLVLG